MNYLIFTTDYTVESCPAIGDGSFLKLTRCEEGWFAQISYKALIDSLEWSYMESETITPIIAEE